MQNLLSKPLVKYPLAFFVGISIAVFFDWIDGGIQFTLQ
jgi:phosphatidylglycerophosphate synthase